MEDSWDAADDAYTPFPGPKGSHSSGDSIAIGSHWASSNRSMSVNSELWNRVSQVRLVSKRSTTHPGGLDAQHMLQSNNDMMLNVSLSIELREANNQGLK